MEDQGTGLLHSKGMAVVQILHYQERVSVEDEVHAILQCCSRDDLLAARAGFWNEDGGFRLRAVNRQANLTNDGLVLKFIMFQSSWAPAVAGLIYRILRIFDSELMYVPPRALLQNS